MCCIVSIVALQRKCLKAGVRDFGDYNSCSIETLKEWNSHYFDPLITMLWSALHFTGWWNFNNLNSATSLLYWQTSRDTFETHFDSSQKRGGTRGHESLQGQTASSKCFWCSRLKQLSVQRNRVRTVIAGRWRIKFRTAGLMCCAQLFPNCLKAFKLYDQRLKTRKRLGLVPRIWK